MGRPDIAAGAAFGVLTAACAHVLFIRKLLTGERLWTGERPRQRMLMHGLMVLLPLLILLVVLAAVTAHPPATACVGGNCSAVSPVPPSEESAGAPSPPSEGISGFLPSNDARRRLTTLLKIPPADGLIDAVQAAAGIDSSVVTASLLVPFGPWGFMEGRITLHVKAAQTGLPALAVTGQLTFLGQELVAELASYEGGVYVFGPFAPFTVAPNLLVIDRLTLSITTRSASASSLINGQLSLQVLSVSTSGTVIVGGPQGFSADLSGIIDVARTEATLRLLHHGGWSPVLSPLFATPPFMCNLTAASVTWAATNDARVTGLSCSTM